MPDSIQTRGFAALEARLAFLPQAIREAVVDTEPYAASLILAQQGGGHPFYPPETFRNAPPAPYYARYRGSVDALGNVTQFSEQLGEQFHSEAQDLEIRIWNTATYAPDVIGPEQSALFAGIGWMKLLDVGRNMLGGVTAWLGKELMTAWSKMGTSMGAWD